MKSSARIFVTVLFFTIALHGAADAQTAKADFYNSEGKRVGTAELTETSNGVLIKASLKNLPQGIHAFHIHSVGQCQPPFKSAGGHYNPYGKKHGILNPKGKHAGDLPNIHVGSDGTITFEVLATDVTLGKGRETLFDEDGSSLVVHAGPDDYKSDPAGNAGPRIACGVITR